MEQEMIEGPIASRLRAELSSKLAPRLLNIVNESHLHAHHQAMKDSTSSESHFRIKIVSDSFKGKSQIQRQRFVYDIFKTELSTPGMIHALSLTTRTPEEEERASSRK